MASASASQIDLRLVGNTVQTLAIVLATFVAAVATVVAMLASILYLRHAVRRNVRLSITPVSRGPLSVSTLKHSEFHQIVEAVINATSPKARSVGVSEAQPVAKSLPATEAPRAQVIVRAAAHVEKELTRAPELSMSDAAWDALAAAEAEHLASVGVEAARIARKTDSVTVDAEHIRAANRYISGESRNSVLATAVLAVGGVVGGAGFAFSIELVTRADPIARDSFITAIVVTVLGTIMLVAGIAIMIANSRR